MKQVLSRLRLGLLSCGMVSTLAIGACSDRGSDDRGTPETAEARFRELELRLLDAETVRVRGGAGSTGTVASALEGEALLASGNRAHLQFTGEFGSASVALALVSDGQQVWGGNGTESFEIEAPTALNEAILLGFTRMGILHNLALLSGASPPDGTDGSIRDWLTVTNFAWGEPETVDGVPTETLRFDVTVHGRPSAQAVLWLGRESGLPVQREQIVKFPDGEMRAVEVYQTVETDAPFESGKFVVP